MGTPRIDVVIPLWSLILFLGTVFLAVLKTYVEFEKLKDRMVKAELELAKGDVKFTKIQEDIHSMSNMLTEIHTELKIYLNINKK